MPSLRSCAAAASFAWTSSASIAHAQDDEIDGDGALDDSALEALLQERVVTTATRSAERASASPSTVYTITQRDLQRYGMRAVDEALSYLGIGVYTQRHRDYASGSDVGVQGQMLRDGNVPDDPDEEPFEREKPEAPALPASSASQPGGSQ